MTKITKKLFKLALEGSIGTQRDMSRRLNVTDGAVFRYLERHPDMKELLEKRRMDNVDKAEHEIFEELEFNDYAKEPAAAARIRQNASQFILSRLGKKRGWVEKQEVELSGNIQTLTKEERESEIKRFLGK